MSDLISRQDAIEIFSQLWDCIDEIADKEEWEDVCKTTANELPSTNQWTPCSERMPEEAYGCLVTIHGDAPFYGEYERVYYELAGWDGECWNDADGCTIPHEVTAWMPSPKPYNTEREV